MAKLPGVLRSLCESPGEAAVDTLPAPGVTSTPFPNQAGMAKNTGVSPSLFPFTH